MTNTTQRPCTHSLRFWALVGARYQRMRCGPAAHAAGGQAGAEAGRDYNTTWIPEMLLRDVYLRPFHAAREPAWPAT